MFLWKHALRYTLVDTYHLAMVGGMEGESVTDRLAAQTVQNWLGQENLMS